MAGVLELMKAAEFKRASANAADPLQSATKAATSGIKAGAAIGLKNKAGGLDQMLKLVELKGKLQDMKTKQENAKMASDLRKAYGVEELDTNEEINSRAGANDGLGQGTTKESDKVKTDKAKITDRFDFEETVTEKGYSYKIKSKPKVKPADRLRIRKTAIDMARKGYAAEVYASKGGEDKVGWQEREQIKNWTPTEVEIAKYTPNAELFLTGKTSTKKAVAEVDKTGKDQVKGELEDVEGLWDLL